MLYFNVTAIDPLGPLAAVFDAGLLVILCSPALYFFVVQPYILDREKEHSIVEFLAHHDELTKLCNRRMFDEHLKRCIPSLARHGNFGALIYFDLDGFKPINDEYGHEMGDRVLMELGSRLSKSLRSEEISARVGGDEFILLIGNAGKDRTSARHHAEVLAQRISTLVREPMAIQGIILQVGCSMGVHILTPSTQSPLLAVKAADLAMYQAKNTQQGSIVFSDTLQKPNYEIVKIGVIEIDHEHQQIDQLLGRLFDPKCDRVQGMAMLIQEVTQHFQNEVKISVRLGLGMTQEHIVEHARLLKLLKGIVPTGDEPVMLEQLATIGQLLQDHILEYDRSLSVVKDAEAAPA
tara:strand:- start:878 stop:1927 length:1050 start_codon:yes stop_codon:yes gene_type:complete